MLNVDIPTVRNGAIQCNVWERSPEADWCILILAIGKATSTLERLKNVTEALPKVSRCEYFALIQNCI